MDKKTLNNEIILCRPAVRKAKVAVIRKLLRKMKILKSCKIEALKEKKLKKSERLFKKVQVMKKIKDDEVTKFALRPGATEALNEPTSSVRQSALSLLAKHEAVVQKVTLIREKVQNWEMELPILLDSLGKKKKKVVNLEKTPKSGSIKTTSSSPRVIKEGIKDGQVKKNVSTVEFKVRNHREAKKPDNQSSRMNNEGGQNDEGSEKLETIQKIEDPFFIGKKIMVPKLILESDRKKKNSNKLLQLDFSLSKRENSSSVLHTKPFKGKRNPEELRASKPTPGAEVEKLHPSWAAKKVKLIKPFQGKKITFSDD